MSLIIDKAMSDLYYDHHRLMIYLFCNNFKIWNFEFVVKYDI